MVTYMKAPHLKVTVTHSGTDYTFEDADVSSLTHTRRENAIDIATLLFSDAQSKNYSAKVARGDTIKIEVKDESDASWQLMLTGINKVCLPDLPPDNLTVKADGAGWGLAAMLCGEEYGSQSTNPTLDTIQEILTDGSAGLFQKWVTCILGGITVSGFNYDLTVENIAGTVPYVYFPYKPCDKAVNDVQDVLQAIKGTNAGSHWIVLPQSTGNPDFVLTTIGSHHAAAVALGWTTYYGGSQAASTVEQGIDFTSFRFQELNEEANHILYYGTLKKPPTEYWTENRSSDWGADAGGAGHGVADDGTIYRMGSYSLKVTTDDSAPTAGVEAYYPSGKNAAWDVEKWGGRYSIPKVNFYMRRVANIQNFLLSLRTDAANYYEYDLGGSMGTALKWYEFSLPIGPEAMEYTMGDEVQLTEWGAPDWADIDYIVFEFGSGGNNNEDAWVDGLFFSGKVVRAAKNSNRMYDGITNPTGRTVLKLITDDVGKDDSGKAADDTGTIARLAYAELLRSQSQPIVGYFDIRMLKDLLPGQLMHVHAKEKSDGTFTIDKDMRVTKLIHSFLATGAFTRVWVTDDVKNSRCRSPYNEMNKVLSAVRPEFQDRQATSIKTRDLDITIPVLEKDYPS